MAVADASLRISIDSISLGLMVVRALRLAPVVAPELVKLLLLETMKPSMTYRGSLLKEI